MLHVFPCAEVVLIPGAPYSTDVSIDRDQKLKNEIRKMQEILICMKTHIVCEIPRPLSAPLEKNIWSGCQQSYCMPSKPSIGDRANSPTSQYA